jgi:hypothetical protein
VELLALRLLLTPLLIGVASLVGRRWGPAVSGWLVCLPFTSGPVSLFLALVHGVRFAATAAVGTLTGVFAVVAYVLIYAWIAPDHGRPPALLAACLGFAGTTILMHALPLSLPAVVPLVVLCLLAAPRLLPRQVDTGPEAVQLPSWDLPARMAVAALFVLLLTSLAPVLGPQLTGLLSPFPIFVTIMAVFAHYQGPYAVGQVLRGVVLGLFSFAGFFAILAAVLVPAGLVLAFIAAIVATLLIQAVALQALRQTRIA